MRINEGNNHQIIYKNLGVVIPLLQRVILAIKNKLSKTGANTVVTITSS